METKIEPNSLNGRKIFVGETIMRGPLIIDLEKLKNIGCWDEGGFFQAYDDHDFCLRAYVLGGYRVGYVPISFASPTLDGTTRKKKSLLSEFSILSNLIRIRQSRKKSQLYLATIFGAPNLPEPEVRNF
jgi:GT2 family glycosyltransferase